MAKETRINKYLAECLSVSRRQAEKYVIDGQVSVNGTTIADLATKVTPKDKVELKGQPVVPATKTYVVFYKPAGYITTRKDEKGRKTIYDILPEAFKKLKPAGRLDRETSGLLLLTDDGDAINAITHPRYHLPKKYRASVKGNFTLDHARQFEKGVNIGEKNPAVAEVIEIYKEADGTSTVILKLTQGYNRQIRKMMEKLNFEVKSLKRLSMGCLNLKNLKRGEHFKLDNKEIKQLKSYLKKHMDEEGSRKEANDRKQ